MKKLIAFVFLFCTCLTVFAQQAPISSEQSRFIEVRRRQIELSSARAAFQSKQNLFKDGLISRTDLDQARAALEKAQLSYQEAVLSLLSLQPRLSVKQAVKYQSRDGRKFVRLTVVNLTPAFDDTQFKMLNDFARAMLPTFLSRCAPRGKLRRGTMQPRGEQRSEFPTKSIFPSSNTASRTPWSFSCCAT